MTPRFYPSAGFGSEDAGFGPPAVSSENPIWSVNVAFSDISSYKRGNSAHPSPVTRRLPRRSGSLDPAALGANSGNFSCNQYFLSDQTKE